jgi:hypothetical protein
MELNIPDKNIKTNILNFFYLMFLLELAYLFYIQLVATYGYDSFLISEFLINYQGGFVRRGLLGELLFFIAKHTAVDIEWTIKIACAVCYLLLCWFFLRSFKKKNYTCYLLPLCFFLGGLILCGCWLRKDCLMLCVFILILKTLYTQKITSNILKILLVNTGIIFVLLIHEVFLFFSLPVLFLLVLSRFRNKYKSFGYSFAALLPSICIALLVVFAHGDKQTAQTIWMSWCEILGSNMPSNTLPGAIDAIGWTSSQAIKGHFSANFL